MDMIKETSIKKHSFAMSNNETCLKQMIFTVRESYKSKTIDSLEIESSQVFCHGLPETIVVLTKNVPLDSLSLNELSKISCSRKISCGKLLERCISDMLKDN
jgi:hypothetical protein